MILRHVLLKGVGATLMESYERTTCSFIVRIWTDVEETPFPKVWRGSISHIPSGARYYFSEVDRLCEIVALHLYQMGVNVPSPFEPGAGSQ